MADFELDEAQEEKGKPKPKPKPKPKKAGGGGGGGPIVIVLAAVALAALGVAVFLFLQFQTLKSKLLADSGDSPPGTAEAAKEAAAAKEGEGGDSDTVQAVREEPEDIVYHLGEFTGNTSDSKFAKMDISILLQSYYNAEDWDVYENQMKVYKEKLKFYQDFEMGKIDAEGKPIGDHAYVPSGIVHAGYVPTGPVHASEGKAAAEPPTLPEEPAKPLSRMERALQKEDPMIRSVVIEQINIHTAAQIISPTGKEEFKQALIKAINAAIEAHIGVVKDVYFSQLVTT
jgi:flagellar basal body-associated protein FliL